MLIKQRQARRELANIGIDSSEYSPSATPGASPYASPRSGGGSPGARKTPFLHVSLQLKKDHFVKTGSGQTSETLIDNRGVFGRVYHAHSGDDDQATRCGHGQRRLLSDR